ncbi:MAG: hypothetical protein EBX49_02360 [Synechococcaceae bacterium WB8_1B_136]|nr:hypothetical protein [Synechococcaceae bacterium WB8_1B_136]
MAIVLPTLSPLGRNSLRIWLAATLTIGIMLWTGRSQVLGLALVMAVLFVNENDFTPARSIGEQIAGALVGILTAMVLHEISTSWVVLGIALLLTGILVRGLGLLKGLGTGYLGCWALELLHQGNRFEAGLIFNMALAVVVGILMAQIATWALWPRRPLQQLPALEAGMASQLGQQIAAMERWLRDGGPPPLPLRSQELLPRIQLLQQLREHHQGLASSATPPQRLQSRWAQAGSLWRQLLRQWLLLEPLLRQLPAPLPQPAQGEEPLLLGTLAALGGQLQAEAAPGPERPCASPPKLWLQEATSLGASKPLLLAIGQQCLTLHQLLHSRALLQASITAQTGRAR